MHPEAQKLVVYLWIGFVVIWGAGALVQKRVVRRESSALRFVHLALGILVGLLLFDKDLKVGFLKITLVPNAPVFTYLGLAFTLAGILFAIWARVFLGGNWSGAVTIKEDHELVRGGPYSLVRHPIYTGILLALLGTAIVLREMRGFVAMAAAVLALWIKLSREEVFMAKQFGAEYTAYKQRVKALIPFIW